MGKIPLQSLPAKALIFLFILIITGVILIFSSTKAVKASDGNTELRSTTSRSYRCHASSKLMTNGKYSILVACRDLIYPVEEGVINYLMWATPVKEGKAIKLGELNRGRANFTTNSAFSSLFVTTEPNIKTKEPTGPVVMRGNVEKITFLEREPQITPGEEVEQLDEMEATPSSSTRDRLVTGLKRAGLVSLLAILAVFGLVFILTRPR